MKKNSLYKQFLKKRDQNSEQKYKAYKNKLLSIIRYRKKQYFESLLDANKTDARETWKILNKLLNRNANSNRIPDTFLDKDKIYKDPQSIAKGFNNFFANIGPNLAAQIPDNSQVSFKAYMPSANSRSFFLDGTNQNEILSITHDLKSKTSEDANGLSMSVVKQVIQTLLVHWNMFLAGLCKAENFLRG